MAGPPSRRRSRRALIVILRNARRGRCARVRPRTQAVAVRGSPDPAPWLTAGLPFWLHIFRNGRPSVPVTAGSGDPRRACAARGTAPLRLASSADLCVICGHLPRLKHRGSIEAIPSSASKTAPEVVPVVGPSPAAAQPGTGGCPQDRQPVEGAVENDPPSAAQQAFVGRPSSDTHRDTSHQVWAPSASGQTGTEPYTLAATLSVGFPQRHVTGTIAEIPLVWQLRSTTQIGRNRRCE